MSNHTIEINEMYENDDFEVFTFPYDFYTDSPVIKEQFEQKFIQHYFFHEIGCETVMRWKVMLQGKLNLIMPYYRQLYESELRAKDIDFLLNKDLVEEFSRELTGSQNSIDSLSSESSQNESVKGSNTAKVSNINDGVASAKLSDGYLTGVTSDDTNSTGVTSVSGSSKQLGNRDNQETETTRLVSRGNIGVTSTAELLEKWRSVMINIDQLIIDECRSLFMQIY